MKFQFKTIRSKILVSFLVLIIPMIVIATRISMTYTENSVVMNSMEYTTQLITQMNSDVDSYIGYMENISQLIMMDGDVHTFLNNAYEELEIRQLAKDRVINQFETILDIRNDITNLAIIGTNGRYLLNRGKDEINPYIDVKQKEWYKKAIEGNGNIYISSSHVQNIVNGSYQWVVSLSRAIIDRQNGEVIGALLVDLNYNVINNLCKKITLGNKGYLFLLDEQGNIIYHPKQQLIYNGLINEMTLEVKECKENYFLTEGLKEKKLYVISRSEKTGWTAVGVANASELFEQRTQTQKLYLISTVIILLIAMLLSILIARAITRPIKKLRDSMKEVEKGNFHEKVDTYGSDEIANLGKSYNIMIQTVEELLETQVKDQEQKRKSELRALQAQINPHFLYNTLDSIVWMAEEGKNQEVVTMTASLAKLFRQSISNEAEEVTLRQEIDYVRNYLIIQKMRYKEQLNYDIQVPESILNYFVIKLVLQPLVENALYHGVKYKEGGGTILVDGYETESTVVLQVIDDGIGMDVEELSHIFEKRKSTQKTNRVAVRNIHNRIQLHYGKEFGLNFESRKGYGTKVKVILPKRMGL
ncbi:cache domain-containing sensor histidine kinase [Lachnoclostridium phytofermentans]|uniref:sensor histidine kinase n=1 Tax=Lachnoclostridium phytofermentans TaxID=66219 RepID=UPI00049670CD|nr:sensor histidine kinase [Lachnoclostridium phytofermentans]